MAEQPTTGRKRDDFLDASRGLLSIFVVVVHAVSGSDPVAPQNQWYVSLRGTLDAFNMSAYMFISGYIVFLSQKKAEGGGMYDYIVKRADRLLIPFVAIGLIILGLKFAVSTVAAVPNMSVSGFADGVYALFIDTGRSPARAIWFVYALFWLTVLHIVCLRVSRHAPVALFAAFSLLYALWILNLMPKPEVMYLDKFVRFGPFFFAGVLFGPFMRWILPQYGLVINSLLAIFVSLLVLRLTNTVSNDIDPLLAIFSVPAIFAIPYLIDNRFFKFIGGYTLAIYLLNTLVIGACTVFVKKLYPEMLVDPVLFVAFIVGVTIIGVVAPVMARMLVLDRIPGVSKYVG